MDRPWLSQYPPGVPAQIDLAACASLKDVLAASCARFADLPAYRSMGTAMSFRQLDDGQPRLRGLAAEARPACSAATASR
jgi:long-chain acyl-CoA synthetase